MSRPSSPRGLALLLAAALGTLSACYGSEPSAPTLRPSSQPAADRATGRGNGTAGWLQQGNSQSSSAHAVACDRRDPVSNSGVFGPGGGTLVIGGSRLVIPGGALRDTVTISATTGGDSTSTVNFQPEGLHFFKPVGLVLDGTGCALEQPETASVVYLAPDGTILETIPAFYDPHWKSVAAPIEHFSGYAIGF